ncbi:MAG: hypothetical protein IPK53_01845 [bacterium]|nr:hypothetical protein [bacterium]
MKLRVLLSHLCLLFAISASAQVRLITTVEYQIDNGSFTSFNVVDGASVNWAEVVSTLGLPNGLHRLRVRGIDDQTRTSQVTDGFFATISNDASGQARVVTDLQYQIDLGSFTNVNLTDASEVTWNDVLATLGLPNGLHRLRVRGTDNAGRTGVISDGFFATISNDGSGLTRVITDLQYQIDGAAFTPVDVTDATSVNWADVLSTIGLPNGLHRVRVRGTDDAGRTSVITDGFFATISNDFSGQTRLATLAEYRIDGGSYAQIDPADAPIFNVNQVISTNALAIGLHAIDFRGVDDLNRVGQIMRALVIVTSPTVVGEARTIIAAEVWFGTDPGAGNGIPVPLPVDGAFDESGEDVTTVFTNQPVGYSVVGYRGRDNTGRWSSNVIDSVLVGPILVVSSAGNDVILNWQFPDGIDQYYIQRAANTAGPFTTIDSTTARTYTDAGIIATQAQGYYTVTFRDDSIAVQLPPGTPAAK